ncbi:GDP-mannose-dependent alpha-mannosyltransferase [compost metagenome]
MHLLIRAFKTILKQREQVAELVLVGDGVYNNELQELSKGIPEIVFVGKKFSDDLLIEYKKADILILPSCSETWGLVVNEALCAGLPVLCSSAVGCIDDLVIRPDAGWIFNTEDEIDLVEKLNHILDNKNQILEKGKRGLELMSSYWNYSLYIENLGKIFEYVKRH